MQTSEYRDFTDEYVRPTISDLLRRDIDAYVSDFRRTNLLFQRAKSGELSRETVGRYLRSIHYLLRHTPVHLALAERRANTGGHVELAAYFARKRGEEAGHDRWAEADISRLAQTFGVSIPHEPTAEMKAIVDANSRTIEENAFLYLAYILFAEYFMVVIGPEWLEALAENCGVPRTFMTAVGNHVELDRDHVTEGCAEIDALLENRLLDRLRDVLQGMMLRFAVFCDGLCAPPG